MTDNIQIEVTGSLDPGEDFIIETDDIPQLPSKSPWRQDGGGGDSEYKHLTRHQSEVFTKREVARTLSVPTKIPTAASTTRTSISRHGSKVQESQREVQTEVQQDDLMRSILQSDEVRQEYRRIRELSKDILNKHAFTTSSYKMPKYTKSYKNALHCLEDAKALFIQGSIGRGKTHLARDVMLTLLSEHPTFEPLMLPSPCSLELLRFSPTCAIVLIDECFGTEGSAAKYLNEVKKMMHTLQTKFDKAQLILILTSRNERMNELDDSNLTFIDDLKCKRIDIDDVENAFSDQEMHTILAGWSKRYQLDIHNSVTEMQQMVAKFKDNCDMHGIGFPEVCQLIGLSTVQTLTVFEDPVGAIETYVEHLIQKEPHYVACLAQVVLSEGLSKAEASEDYLKRIIDLLSLPNISIKDTLNCLLHLQKQGVVCEQGEKYFVSSRSLYCVLLNRLASKDIEKCLRYLPIRALNAINFEGNESSARDVIEHRNYSYTLDLKTVSGLISRFSNAMETKKSQEFHETASSKLWLDADFIDNMFRVYGYHFFFSCDEAGVPFSAYLVRTGNTKALNVLVRNIEQIQKNNFSSVSDNLEKIKLEACAVDNEDVIVSLFSLAPAITPQMVHAAINNSLIDLTIQLVQSALDSDMDIIDSELIRLSCEKGSFETVSFLFSKMNQKRLGTETRKRDSRGLSLLHNAVISGSIEIYDLLIKQGLDPSAKARNGFTVLHFSAMYGNLKIMKHICAHNPNLINEIDANEMHCAHVAAREGQHQVFKFLLETGVRTDLQAKGQNTFLHIAAFNGWTEIIRVINAKSTQLLNQTNLKSFTPAHLAAKSGHVDALLYLLEIGEDYLATTIDKRTYVHLAAFSGTREMLTVLCRKYPDLISKSDVDGNTPLHDAAAGGNVEIFNDLIQYGLSPFTTNADGATVLHDACFYGKLEMVKFICLNYSDLINVRTDIGLTPVFGAALGGYLDIMKYMLERGAELEILSKENSSLLHEAAFTGKLEMVQFLAQKFPNMVNRRNLRSFMPCHFAAQEGHLEVLLYLLPKQPSDFPVTKEKQTIMHIAAYNKMLPIVKYICQKFPSLMQLADSDGANPLHYAARGGSTEVFDYLIEKGLDPESKTHAESTVLHLAAYDGNHAMVIHICEKFSKLVHTLDSTGHSPAHYAAGSGELPLLLNILEYGVDPRQKAGNGATLLMKAAWNGKPEMVQYLCTSYPDLKEKKDVLGCDCLHYAACGGHVHVIQYLIEEGLDPFSTSTEGHTILQVAVYHGKMKTVKFLSKRFPQLLYKEDQNGKNALDYAKQVENIGMIQLLNALSKKAPGNSDLISEVFCCQGRDSCCNWLTTIFCFCRK
ncbi:uncharacterized protein LOC127876270 [Dreissena polymorpha]|uniref:Novel STAND NTPase 3 domain-containing protein n=1 Tax=Dreissena polymorpha TaxID=45954 RepID=A0A9D4QMR4_DREPO|nr:uncharacterized protein LOC127876270 [Dreissena polymorpha]KAH3835815.1 hypothetical protein DPMN_109179 [Dreissena polymorpha]